MIGIQ